MSKTDPILILTAFVLDLQVEHPELVVIAQGKKEVLLGAMMAQNPDIRPGLIKERAAVYSMLGWEVPHVK